METNTSERGRVYGLLFQAKMPGYILGLERTPGAENRFMSHIYQGTFSEPGDPLCPKGWNRDNGESYSIWRNNLGRGICGNCMRKLLKELPTKSREESNL